MNMVDIIIRNARIYPNEVERCAYFATAKTEPPKGALRVYQGPTERKALSDSLYCSPCLVHIGIDVEVLVLGIAGHISQLKMLDVLVVKARYRDSSLPVVVVFYSGCGAAGNQYWVLPHLVEPVSYDNNVGFHAGGYRSILLIAEVVSL